MKKKETRILPNSTSWPKPSSHSDPHISDPRCHPTMMGRREFSFEKYSPLVRIRERYLSSVCFEIQSIEENKTGSNKNRNEFLKRNWKGISTKGFDWVGLPHTPPFIHGVGGRPIFFLYEDEKRSRCSPPNGGAESISLFQREFKFLC